MSKKIAIIALIIILLIAVGGAAAVLYVACLTKERAEVRQPQPPVSINPKDYAVANYPLKQSPIYNQLDEDCFDPYWADAQDTRLVKNQTEILIPSLLQLVSLIDNEKPDCGKYVSAFSIPESSKYLYLQTSFLLESDLPYSGLSGIYRLDLSNLSVKKLSVSDFVAAFDLYRGLASDSYKLLSDGKRLIKWNMNGVYLVNLENDSISNLYLAPQNQWLISSIVFEMGQVARYDVKIEGNKAIVGVYDKTKTQEGYPIKIDQYGDVEVESSTWDREGDVIRPRFIDRVTVSIPD